MLACRSASSYKILLKSDNRLMTYGQKSDFQDGGRPPCSVLKILIFGHVTVIGFSICCNVPYFIKIRHFFTEIWLSRNLQNGGSGQSAILDLLWCHNTASRYTFNVDRFCFVVSEILAVSQVGLFVVHNGHGNFVFAHTLYHVTVSWGPKLRIHCIMWPLVGVQNNSRMNFLSPICLFTMLLLFLLISNF